MCTKLKTEKERNRKTEREIREKQYDIDKGEGKRGKKISSQ